MKKTQEHYRANILGDLKKAGKRGMTKTKLKIKAGTKKEKALLALEKSRQISNLGTKSSQRWVLAIYDQPLEDAHDHILEVARTAKIQLLPKTVLEKGLKGKVKSNFPEALRLLLQEQKLFRLKASGTDYYIHHDRIPRVNTVTATKNPPSEDSSDVEFEKPDIEGRIMAAYNKLVENSRFGFLDVHISELREESGVSQKVLESFLKAKSRKGKAVLSLGDWSLSSEDVRSGAIYLDGTPHLLVRFRQEA